jgi:hypothetical protein
MLWLLLASRQNCSICYVIFIAKNSVGGNASSSGESTHTDRNISIFKLSTSMANAQGYATKPGLMNLLYTWTKRGGNL